MKKLFEWFRSNKVEDNDQSEKPEIESNASSDGSITYKLADTRQVINSTTQLPLSGIDEMVARKHDLEYQLALTLSIMEENSILPFPFERSVILLRKAERYEEELEICRYIQSYSEKAEANWDGWSAKVWRSPKLEKCVSRISKIQELIKKNQT